jgi:maleate isomerase
MEGTVRVAFTPDAGLGRRARIGLIVPATDQVSEHAMRAMLPGGDVAFYATRLANRNPTTLENLRAMAAGLGEAAAVILPGERLDAIAFACTSAVVALGAEAVLSRLAAGRPGVPCTTPMTAAVAAFDRLGMRRIALLTPYVDEVNRSMCRFFADHGIEVTALASFGLESDADMARVPPDAIRDAGLLADSERAEALFISCTALPVFGLIARIEAAIGKPVVTSNQASIWAMRRHAGLAAPLGGHGRLLAA